MAWWCKLNMMRVHRFLLGAGNMEENQRWLPTPVSPPHPSWLKKCLQAYFGSRPDVERGVHTEHTAHHSRKLLIVAFLVMLALVVMGLLLFWNYQCIFVWRLCYENEEVSSGSDIGDR